MNVVLSEKGATQDGKNIDDKDEKQHDVEHRSKALQVSSKADELYAGFDSTHVSACERARMRACGHG